MTDALDQTPEAMRRRQFYEEMAEAEKGLRADHSAWNPHLAERETWLNPELTLLPVQTDQT